MKALSVYHLVFKFKGHTVLEKDWDAPADICIIRELLAVRANKNLASIGLKLLRRIKIRKGNSKLVSSLSSTLVHCRSKRNTFLQYRYDFLIAK